LTIGGDGVDVVEADVGAIEAVCLVYFGDVFGFRECDVDAREQTRSMNCRLHHLNRRIIADFHRRVCRQRNLWEAERSWIRVLARTDDLEDGYHGEGHVGWAVVWSIGSEA